MKKKTKKKTLLGLNGSGNSTFLTVSWHFLNESFWAENVHVLYSFYKICALEPDSEMSRYQLGITRTVMTLTPYQHMVT